MQRESLYSDTLFQLANTQPITHALTSKKETLENRLCGDKISIAVEWNNTVLKIISWEIEGCVILKASAAFMVKFFMEEKDVPKNKQMLLQNCQIFKKSFSEKNFFRESKFSFVYNFPARYKCAILPWQALENLLRDGERT